MRRWPARLWLGLLLVAVFWAVNWAGTGMRTHWAFFPLWLGYCLAVDGIVLVRRGTSLMTRSGTAYVGLFLASVPTWWLFELINHRTRNWIYLTDGSLGVVAELLLSSLCFSTVIPAVFGTAELVATWRWVERLRAGPRLSPGPGVLLAMEGAGLAMIALVLLWPRYFFPLVWTSVYLIVEPVNALLGHRSLLDNTREGDWRAVLSLAVGALVCGFFWEMWNTLSFPKWVYRVPFVDVLHVFEMPLLGYGGYVPFALELFAVYHFLAEPLSRGRVHGYVRIGPSGSPSGAEGVMTQG